jgi:tetratricopeptide (TPR) repeat protein
MSFRRVVGALATCLLSACAATREGPDVEAAKAYLEEGREAAGRGNHEAAIGLYTQALRAHPEFPEAYYARGYSRVKLRLDPEAKGDPRVLEEEAYEDYRMALRYNPGYADAYFNRAMLLSSRAQYRRAAEDLLHAIQARPGDSEPHLWLARLYEEKFENKTPEALDHYEKYVDLGGTDPETREKVRIWKELKKQAAQPSSGKTPTPEDEKKAQELHETFKRLFADGKKDEAVKAIETLVTQYGHTKYVQERQREFNALLNALKK